MKSLLVLFVITCLAAVADAQPLLDAGVPVLTSPVANDPQGLPPIVVDAPTANPAPPTPDVSLIQAKWRGGQFVAAAVLALYLVLVALAKVDTKRAFYYTSGVLVVGGLVEAIVAGVTPTYEMLMMAALALGAILVKGPHLGAPKGGG